MDKKQCPHCKQWFKPAGYARWHGDNCVERNKEPKFRLRDVPFLGITTLCVAFTIASVAAWYSILGLTTIFAGATLQVGIMATTLEVGKVMTATWLHFRWSHIPILMKTYLTTAVAVLMLITSIGVFGFLSKAHLEHTMNLGGNNEIQISTIERQVQNQRRVITDAEQVIQQLDAQVQTLIEYDRLRGPDGSIALRESQKEERETLNQTINDAYSQIETLQTKLLPLQKRQLALEAEVGPLKYIAALIYGDEAKDHFDEAVRWLIILLVITFDPLAIVLTIAGLMSFKNPKEIIKIRNPDALVME